MKPSVCAAPLVACLVACSSSSGSPQTTQPPVDGGASGDSGGAASDAGDTWVSWAQGFFATYCVECHGASDPVGRDYRQQANVVKEKLEVRCGVASAQDPAWACMAFPPAKQFPISDSAGTNPKPTDAERARAVAWITAGCP